MHIALAVGTMLLGSWVLNAPEEEDETRRSRLQPPAMAPATTKPSTPYNMPMGPRPSRMDREQQGRPTRADVVGQRVTHATPGGRTAATPRSSMTGAPMDYPMAPTGALPPGGMYWSTDGARPCQWTAGPRSDRRAGGLCQAAEPTAPTAQLSGPAQARPEAMSRALVEMNRNDVPSASAGPSVAPPAPADKAFSGFRPSSGVSPYMNLFRIQGDTLDNYTSLVRPQIEQRFLNQQFGHDIRGLADQCAHARGEHATAPIGRTKPCRAWPRRNTT